MLDTTRLYAQALGDWQVCHIHVVIYHIFYCSDQSLHCPSTWEQLRVRTGRSKFRDGTWIVVTLAHTPAQPVSLCASLCLFWLITRDALRCVTGREVSWAHSVSVICVCALACSAYLRALLFASACYLTCGKESGLLELCVGQRLLVVQNTGVEQGARSVALLECLSLW